jgi:hypothetical protein
MGLSKPGMDEWIADLESLPARAPEAFKRVMGKAGMNIKRDWKAGWKAISGAGHIPHLIRFIGYDVPPEKGSTFSVIAGPKAGTLQSGLAAYIEYGTLTSAPHPAGQHALDVELPKMQAAAAKVAEDLLNETR